MGQALIGVSYKNKGSINPDDPAPLLKTIIIIKI